MSKQYCFYCLSINHILHSTDKPCGYDKHSDRGMSEDEAKRMTEEKAYKLQKSINSDKKRLVELKKAFAEEFA